MSLFSSNSGSYLGIDIGSSSVKIVELKRANKKIELVNYSFAENVDFKLNSKSEYLYRLLSKMYEEAEFGSNKAVVSLPTSEVFSSVINLSGVNKDNLNDAVKNESAKIMPIDIEDIALDWKIVDEDKKNKNVKVFITGSPKSTIKKYVDIFKNFDVNLLFLETEIFSLIRAFSMSRTTNQMIVEIGASTTDVSIIKNDVPILNKSMKIGGNKVTQIIGDSLGVGLKEAERFKKDLGLLKLKDGEILPEVIINAVEPIINEVKYIISLFQNKYSEEIDSIILSGGSVILPNFVEHMSRELNINISIGDPWYDVEYKKGLKPVLDEIGPSLAVAIGLAKRELI